MLLFWRIFGKLPLILSKTSFKNVFQSICLEEWNWVFKSCKISEMLLFCLEKYWLAIIYINILSPTMCDYYWVPLFSFSSTFYLTQKSQLLCEYIIKKNDIFKGFCVKINQFISKHDKLSKACVSSRDRMIDLKYISILECCRQ
jgi:hypothetical protein